MDKNNKRQVNNINNINHVNNIYFTPNELPTINNLFTAEFQTYLNSILQTKNLLYKKEKSHDNNYYFINNHKKYVVKNLMDQSLLLNEPEVYVDDLNVWFNTNKYTNLDFTLKHYPNLAFLPQRKGVFIHNKKFINKYFKEVMCVYDYIPGITYKQYKKEYGISTKIHKKITNNLIALKNYPLDNILDENWKEIVTQIFTTWLQNNLNFIYQKNNQYEKQLKAFNELNIPEHNFVFCLSHNDLHESNIILTQRDHTGIQPVFIDTNMMRPYFLGADLYDLVTALNDETILITYLNVCTLNELKAIYMWFYAKTCENLFNNLMWAKNYVINWSSINKDVHYCEIIKQIIAKKNERTINHAYTNEHK